MEHGILISTSPYTETFQLRKGDGTVEYVKVRVREDGSLYVEAAYPPVRKEPND